MRSYLAASLLTLAVFGGVTVLILWALWGYRLLRDISTAFREGRAEAEHTRRQQQAWRLRASRRWLREFDKKRGA